MTIIRIVSILLIVVLSSVLYLENLGMISMPFLNIMKPLQEIKVVSGEMGKIGHVGPEGLMGSSGHVGLTGSVGPEGLTGPMGSTGPVGPQGLIGIVGQEGPVGATGAKGDTGLAGAKGDTGLAGTKGDTGLVGAKGDTGLAGTVGAKGDTGLQGATGLQGIQGIQGVGLNCNLGRCELVGDTFVSQAANASFQIKNRSSSANCLASTSTGLAYAACTTGTNQQWFLKSV